MVEIDDIMKYLKEKSVEEILNEALAIESRYLICDGKEEFIGYRIYLPFGHGWYVDTDGGVGKDGEMTLICCDDGGMEIFLYDDDDVCKRLCEVEGFIKNSLMGGDKDGRG